MATVYIFRHLGILKFIKKRYLILKMTIQTLQKS